jgi:hypothetical protein
VRDYLRDLSDGAKPRTVTGFCSYAVLNFKPGGTTGLLDREPRAWFGILMKASLPLAFLFILSAFLRADEPKEQKPFDVTTLLGETYHHCRIIKVTPEAITLAHETGVSKVSFELLGDEWRTRYHYDPDKARVFVKEEDEKRRRAEAERKRLQKDYEEFETGKMAQLALEESKRAQSEANLAKQQADAATALQAKPVNQIPTLMPLPGDINPPLMTVTPVTTATEVVIPPSSPLSQIYTPGLNNGQRFIINQGTVFTPGDGALYYINPGYVPGYANPPIMVNPPTTIKPQPSIPPVLRSGGTILKDGVKVTR